MNKAQLRQDADRKLTAARSDYRIAAQHFDQAPTRENKKELDSTASKLIEEYEAWWRVNSD